MNFSRSLLLGSLAFFAISSAAYAQDGDDGETNVAELNRISNRLRIEAEAEKREALRMAPLMGIAVKGTNRLGQGMELMAIRDGRPYYYITDNADAAITTRTVDLYPGGSLGLSLLAGETVREWDQGTVLHTHQELAGRVSKGDAEVVNGDHATHVGGTMIGWGVVPAARGMTRSILRSFGWNSDAAEMAAEAAAGARLSNHSYGGVAGWFINNPPNNTLWSWAGNTGVSSFEDFGFGLYDKSAADWDSICRNAPYYLPVKAAGNSRNSGPAGGTGSHYHGFSGGTVFTDTHSDQSSYDLLPYYATAKNILVVAAVNDVPSYTGPGSVTMSTFSSWGPTDDGRIKPDISANGVDVFSSTAKSDTSYASLSGTSMAAPNATGTLGLLLQHWRNTHTKDPKSATMKALVIHTARECGGWHGPDYAFGWGLLDAHYAANVISADVTNPHIVTERRLVNGKPHRIWVHSPDAFTKIVGTIAWTDKAGPVAGSVLDDTTLRLVNDLDMTIGVPGVHTAFPWILDPANPSAGAGVGNNFRDNVEQVDGRIYGRPGGWYLVTIKHKGTLSSPNYQDYSLILTGIDKVLRLQKVTLTPTTVQGGAANIRGAVTLTYPAPPGGLTVNLRSNNPRALVPPTVFIAEGRRTGKFTVTTKAVGVERTFKITASFLPSSKSASGTLTL